MKNIIISLLIFLGGNFLFAQNSLFEKGDALVEAGKFEAAIPVLTEAIKQGDNIEKAFYARGYAYYCLEKWDASFADYNQILKMNKPGTFLGNQAMYFIGIIYRRKGEYEKAILWHDSLYVIGGATPGLLKNRGKAKAELGDLEGALEDFAEGLALNPWEAELFDAKGLVYYKLDRSREAVNLYDQALMLVPELVGCHYRRGLAHRRLGNREAALADFNKAIKLDPTYSYSYFHRSMCYSDLEKYSKALKDAQKAVSMEPENGAFHSMVGDAYLMLEKYDLCAKAFEETLKYDIDSSTTYLCHNNIGFCNLELGNYEEALPSLNRALEWSPNSGLPYNNRGFALLKLGQLDEAMKDVDLSIKLRPENSYAFRNKALIWLELGETDKACKDWQEAIRLKHNVKDKHVRGLRKVCR